MTDLAYCTILARNYLPKALTLGESLRRHHNTHSLTVFLIDGSPELQLPKIDGIRWMFPTDLDLPARTVLELAMSYQLVEFATAIKPLVLQTLLREHENVAYLDPDTFVTSPMDELEPALDTGSGIVLTPHYLEPTPAGGAFSEGHLLHVGVYNLGFCAVNRNAKDFLAWWWGHLREECLQDPIAGLFVDQKWVDIGSVLFDASALRHYGYNVGVGNLHERPVDRDEQGYWIPKTGDRLRLFHFHAFDPSRPNELYTRRAGLDTTHLRAENAAIDALCQEYAQMVLANAALIGAQPPYIFATDTRGRRISHRLRAVYRAAVRDGAGSAPSPFVPAEADQWDEWRRSARAARGRLAISDTAKAVRCAFPDEYDVVKAKFPGLSGRLRKRYVQSAGMWD